jgi:very-short-patch-repair endonuclease
MVTRQQLLGLGFTSHAIRHRQAEGRLYAIWPGVYCVGWDKPDRLGKFMGAVLFCGGGPLLSHESAAALWGIRRDRTKEIHVTVSYGRTPKGRGIVVHRTTRDLRRETAVRSDIPVTSPLSTLIDLATYLPRNHLEAAINEADKLDLIAFEHVSAELAQMPRRPGVRKLRRLLGEHTFLFTDSELERAFLRLVRRAGLPLPRTQQRINAYRVDFFWPDLDLIVEVDGGRFHRTPIQQTNDRTREHAHFLARLTPLRFTHGQIHYTPDHVVRVLTFAAAQNGYATT